jgi:hypothetical protein
MIVESEPNGFLMVRYKLYFNQQSPDPEDARVLAYLDEHGLQPRRQLDEKHQDIPYKVLHFGQCYLKRHIHPLGELYQLGVECSALRHHIRSLLDATEVTVIQATWSCLDEAACQAAVATLADQLHECAHFEVSEHHGLQVTVDASIVVHAFIALQSTI